jgi:hypothetical protein
MAEFSGTFYKFTWAFYYFIRLIWVIKSKTVTFEWIICPTDTAAGWSIPLNIDFTFYDRDEEEGYPIYFTVANICVSDEHSSGSVAHTTTDPSSTDQPSSEGSPGFGVLTAVLSIVLMMLWMRSK